MPSCGGAKGTALGVRGPVSSSVQEHLGLRGAEAAGLVGLSRCGRPVRPQLCFLGGVGWLWLGHHRRQFGGEGVGPGEGGRGEAR